MGISSFQREIFLNNKHLLRGQGTYKVNCPSCGEHGSFSVTNNGIGLLYHCFRNSCGIRGFIPFDVEQLTRPATIHTLKKHTEDPVKSIVPLEKEHIKFFKDKFEIDEGQLDWWQVGWAPKEKRIAFKVHDSEGNVLGRSYRRYDEFCPEKIGRKTLHFPIDDSSPFAFYGYDVLNRDSIIIVEDPVSCIKLHDIGEDFGFGAIALLGTNFSSDLAKLLANKEVFIWLDRDAIKKSHVYKNEFGLFFKHCRILSSEKDPKDLDENEIMKIILT